MYIATEIPQYRAVVTLKHVEEPMKKTKWQEKPMFETVNVFLVAWAITVFSVWATGNF